MISFFVLFIGKEKRTLNETNRESYESYITYSYKYLRIDSISNTTKKGIVSLPHEIIALSEGGVESVTYEPSIGVHILFSKFGSDEYYCTGSCYCNIKNEERRLSSTSVPVVRGLLYLVTSFTSVLAIKKAEEYFSNECVLGLEEECPINSIHSTVDGCKPVLLVDNKSDEVDGSTKTKDTDTEFMCTGRCNKVDSHLAKFDVHENLEEELDIFHSSLENEEQFEDVLVQLKGGK